MSTITNRDLIDLHLKGQLTPEKAVEKSMKLGLNHLELAVFLEIEPPGPKREAEETAPKVRRVTARGMLVETAEGRSLPWTYAGRHRWTRDPDAAPTTHDLCETQYRDVKAKAAKQRGFQIIRDEPIVASATNLPEPTEQKSSPSASKGRPQQQARR